MGGGQVYRLTQCCPVVAGADGTTYLVDGAGDKAMNVLVLPKDLWEGGAECRGRLHCWERHFTYREETRVEVGVGAPGVTLMYAHCSVWRRWCCRMWGLQECMLHQKG